MPSSEVIRNNNRLFQYALRDAPERQSNKEPSWRKRFFRFFNQFFFAQYFMPSSHLDLTFKDNQF